MPHINGNDIYCSNMFKLPGLTVQLLAACGSTSKTTPPWQFSLLTCYIDQLAQASSTAQLPRNPHKCTQMETIYSVEYV